MANQKMSKQYQRALAYIFRPVQKLDQNQHFLIIEVLSIL